VENEGDHAVAARADDTSRSDFLQALTGGLEDGIAIVDEAGRIVEFFGRLGNAAGWTREQLVGRLAHEFAHPEDRARGLARLRRHLERPRPDGSFRLDGRVATANGGWVSVEATATDLRRHPLIRGTVFCLRDVTPRLRAEDELERRRRQFETVASNVPTWIILTDLEGRFEFSNRAINGVEPEELVGRPVSSVVRPDEYERFQRHHRLAVERRASADYRSVLDGGRRVLENVLAPVIVRGAVIGVASNVVDVSERLELERELLEISSREQRRFGSDLHDGLGQELTGIALTLKSLLRTAEAQGSPLAKGIEEVLGYANAAIDTTRRMARGVSPVGREQGGLQRALVDLAQRRAAEGGPAIVVAVDPQLPRELEPLVAEHLYRIVQETVTNAIRHAGATRLDVKLDLEHDADGPRVRLAIRDDGCGIDPAAELGPGMGLKIMRYRVEQLRGRLLIRPAENGGTCIECTCPLGSL
jgi:PAS domain S-box-containing protein